MDVGPAEPMGGLPQRWTRRAFCAPELASLRAIRTGTTSIMARPFDDTIALTELARADARLLVSLPNVFHLRRDANRIAMMFHSVSARYMRGPVVVDCLNAMELCIWITTVPVINEMTFGVLSSRTGRRQLLLISLRTVNLTSSAPSDNMGRCYLICIQALVHKQHNVVVLCLSVPHSEVAGEFLCPPSAFYPGYAVIEGRLELGELEWRDSDEYNVPKLPGSI